MFKKTILFDLDGTLTDSGEGIMKSAAFALDHYGITYDRWESLRDFVGPPLFDTFIKYGVPDAQADTAVAVYRSRYNSLGKFENHPYEGIPELLARLQEEGYQLLVATSKPEALSIEIMEKFDIAKYFHRICGASLDRSRSSKEDVIDYLLNENETAEEIVMVGDTTFDIIGAAAHKIPGIGVAWGYGKVQDMIDVGAAAIAYTVEELYNLLIK